MSQVNPTPVTTLPPAPSSTNPSNFDSLMDALLAALAGFVTGVNNIATNVYNNAVDCYNNAVAALASSSSAASSANIAQASANFKGSWSALTGALAKPASVFNAGAFWVLLNNLADVTTSQPGVTADWQPVGGAFPIVAINTNTTAAPYKTYYIYGACTLTLPAVSGNNKQVCVIVPAGVVGAILAPAGTDKIRGASGNQTFDATPFSATITDSGATYGWI